MKYELIKQSFGLPKNLMNVVTDKDGKTTETPTGKMFMPIDLTIKDVNTLNPANEFNVNIIVEFEKTLSIEEVEELCEEKITEKLTEINK